MNGYTLPKSFAFAIMVSLDMDLLFTSVPLTETIQNCIDELFKSGMTVSDLNKKEMFEMIFLFCLINLKVHIFFCNILIKI